VADATSSHSILSRLVAEAFGTFLLVFAIVGFALFISGQTGPLGPALAIGLAVVAPIAGALIAGFTWKPLFGRSR
jgi:aquaporin Z